MRVVCTTLYSDDNKALGTFSSHWAACAVMIRFTDPTFKPLKRETPADLELEAKIRSNQK